jgi:tripartite-type tricarboxylate transporter receptor subunit TctC
MFAPAKTPARIVDRLHQEVKSALMVPSVREHYAALGLDPVGSSPADFKRFLSEQVREYAELVKIAKIEPQ